MKANGDKAGEHSTSQHKLLHLNGKSLSDQVGKLEDLPNSLEEIFSVVSVFMSECLEIDKSEHLNVKKEHRDYRSYFNQRTWDKVAERYEKDIDIFNYSFMK